ncbi:MAG TPA: hypothetical protein VJ938_13420, partial [Acidimicrobiia bacterium]|nr:hypothetical protein [Acidimicrobiia bacterium]
ETSYFEHMFHLLPPWHRSCGTNGAAGSEVDHELDVTDVIRIKPGFSTSALAPITCAVSN